MLTLLAPLASDLVHVVHGLDAVVASVGAVGLDVPAPGGIEQGPEPEDVKAGWTAFAIFFGLCGVVALLCWSFVRQIGKARAARDAGVYGDPPAEPRADAGAGAPESGAPGAPDSRS